MEKQEEFLDKLKKLKESLKEGEQAATEVIRRALGKGDLTEEQAEMIRSYLQEDADKKTEDVKESQEDSAYLADYLKEIRDIPRMDEASARLCFAALKEGDADAREKLIRERLELVVELAEQYRHRGAALADLIQEGNIGLIRSVESAAGLKDYKKLEEFIKMGIKEQMEQYLDEEMNGSDRLETLLAKINLVLEASRQLMEELGRRPLAAELSEYTKMPEQEIEALLGLSKEAGDIIYS